MVGQGTLESHQVVPVAEQSFEPVRYRPLPAQVTGLKEPSVSLDGVWRINPEPGPETKSQPLDAAGWGNFTVPGQWAQQGYDIPQDKTVALAREFTVPAEWAGYRIFLRFDAIHAGTIYTFNGQPLGKSENLFTPVEWEITRLAKPGQTNRLDLAMKVDTASERLSHASGYAFHSLGGIDRAVRLFALPQVHLKDLRLLTDLDRSYCDAELKLDLTLDTPEQKSGQQLALHISLLDASGKPADISTSTVPVGMSDHGTTAVSAVVRVTNPLKWSAEKPHLYKLVLVLKDGESLLERVERNVGFRKIEIKDRQVFINGQRVKFAGACHHELDPLTGRAGTGRHGEQDVKLMKDVNLNYLRTSHYPPTPELLDAADRLGMYVECEAPFCWVAPADDLTDLKEVLTPTSAMIDNCHTHPSVIIWSVANESHWSEIFDISNKLCKQLDPTRPTTFNHPFSNEDKENCDIANRHYPAMPYDDVLKDDPRPLYLGEYFFPVCHEQTDVRIDPGLRELWGHGQSNSNPDWDKACSASFDTPFLLPGARPGVWNSIYHSNRVIGGAIFAALDEPFYFKNGKHAGYAWVHGFWGLIDAWRRPKPEWWLAKLIFAPVWFPVRQVDWPTTGQSTVRIPVENRYSFTNLKELRCSWQIGEHQGKVNASLAPGASGELKLPVPAGTREGEQATLRVTNGNGDLINVVKITLGKEPPLALPRPQGAPRWVDDGKTVVVSGDGFGLVFDRTTGELAATDPKHQAAITRFPALHLTRHDFGDLAGPNAPPYAELPDTQTRVIDEVSVKELPEGLELAVRDHYDGFAGSVRWLIDKHGTGRVSYDYVYSGGELSAREIGVKCLLQPECDELTWRRWSEWGVFPEDDICRTEGSAKARRSGASGPDPEGVPPSWPWGLDQTELGTNDFRGIKFNIYEASLAAPDGSGIGVNANADAHLRACLAANGVKMHLLTQCRLGPVMLKTGDKVAGEFVVRLLHR